MRIQGDGAINLVVCAWCIVHIQQILANVNIYFNTNSYS